MADCGQHHNHEIQTRTYTHLLDDALFGDQLRNSLKCEWMWADGTWHGAWLPYMVWASLTACLMPSGGAACQAECWSIILMSSDS